MKKSLLLTGILFALLFACQNATKQTKENSVGSQDTARNHQQEQTEPSLQVSLNNGEKWKANAETTEGIKKMATLIEEFPQQSSLSDYHSLKEEIERELNTILQKCTMTGEAHEQLHHYLLPMIEMIKDLNSPEIETCRNSFNSLKEHLNEYENYFQ